MTVRRLSKDDWDTPGGPGGKEELAKLQRITPGAAPALHRRWREIVGEIADRRCLKYTVRTEVFNTFRADRLDAGITDEQLAGSFEAFTAALSADFISVPHGDLWRLYASTWARWLAAAPTGSQRALRGRDGSPRRQR